MAYSDFLKNIDDKFKALFNEISAEYNFDNGPEFEIALCKVFRIILPNKYGICRGFIVSKNGNIAGDDIIIYDQERFPTLRLLEDNSFAQKQKIPVEAVYAYIEAKHTLCIEGNGGQSLQKSLNQIASIKEIERNKVPLTQITPQIAIQSYNANWPNYWPNHRNPMYTAIISRQIRLKENSPVLDKKSAFNHFETAGKLILTNKNAPDLIIAGSDIIAIPSVSNQIESPFFVPDVSKLASFETEGQAFGLGIINMMYAFDNIMLGNIYWQSILSDGLNLELKV